jgi:ADP-ribose pyrophosphatase
MADGLTKLGERLRWRGRKFDFVVEQWRLPNGTQGDMECLRHPGGAMVVPVAADGRLVLLDQFRFPVEGRLLEFPAGTLEPDEAPGITVRRELAEEAGYQAAEWHHLGTFPLAPGYCDEYIHAFLARGLEALAEPPPGDDDEDIRVRLMAPAELEAAIGTGSADAKTLAGLLLARPFLEDRQERP